MPHSGTHVIEIGTYSYHLFSSRTEMSRVILLYGTNGAKLASVFFVDGDNPPLPVSEPISGYYILNYPRAAFPDIIDMLRNEKPCYLHYVPAGTNNTKLATTQEPVGEGELEVV